ncbi:unnamed protein product, partial [Didymodactylos carnosus]
MNNSKRKQRRQTPTPTAKRTPKKPRGKTQRQQRIFLSNSDDEGETNVPPIQTITPVASTSVQTPSLSAQTDSQLTDNEALPQQYLTSNVWQHAKRNPAGTEVTCNLCGKVLKTPCGSTTAVRSHLVKQHKLVQLILPSKQRQNSGTLPVDQKRKLHQLCIEAIIEDSRPFGDLAKPGILRLIQYFVP